ncbi:MAG: lysine biosynthesis protein LysX [Candidatus Micrarchaeota archaeon]|nr:lysine biosynthesis protein LysX [Candidatus Micrarchaeota archaeon]
MKLAICYTIISAENKMLIDSAKKRGAGLERIVDGESMLALPGRHAKEYHAMLQRSVSYSRSQALTYFFERQGSLVINSYRAASICGDKMITSLELAKSGVPTPKTLVAFTPESARLAAKELGFPFVVKPVMGSWARMVHRINDSDSLDAALESREEMGNPWQKIYYFQEHINKPGRDIRAFVVGDQVVAAIYRHSTEKSGWITNTGRGGTASKCEVTPELCEISLKAVSFLDEGIYGVDLMESENGLVVHEVNHTTEFRNSSPVTGVDIGDKMIEYFLARAKK